MLPLKKAKTFNNYSVNFERRNYLEKTKFPLTDSDGCVIRHDRRISDSIYLSKIEMTELQVQEKEFKQLFKK